MSVIKILNNEIEMCKLSTKYSPNILVTKQPQKTYDKLTSLVFGEYAEVYAAN